MPTSAYITFQAAFGDAEQLLDIYDSELKATASTAPDRIEVLKRASLILAVTAWETYLEDLLQERFTPLLKDAASPSDLQNAFNQVAQKWLKTPGSLTVTGLTSWTGEGWRKQIERFFADQIKALNTPNSKNAKKLFRDFLNIDLETVWKWQNYNFDSACKRLDEIVSKRGTFTHVARRRVGSVPTKDALSRQQVMSYLKFFEEIASATDAKVCGKN